MKITTATPAAYRPLMRALHWLMALAITTLLVSGPMMTAFAKDDSLRAAYYTFHKSIGALVLVLVLMRLVVRLVSTLPPLPAQMPARERTIAQAGHWLLYLMMIAAPITGWATSDLHGYGVTLFGLPLPKLFPTLGPEAGADMSYVHSVLTYTFLGLLALHLLAIAKHRYIDRQCVMSRMA